MKRLKISLTLSLIFFILFSMNVYAGEWLKDFYGWRYKENGNALSNGWYWIQDKQSNVSKCYYFNFAGYMLENTFTPDGNYVNGSGQWVVDGKVQRKVLSSIPTPTTDPSHDAGVIASVNGHLAGSGNDKKTQREKDNFILSVSERDKTSVNDLEYNGVKYLKTVQVKNGGSFAINMGDNYNIAFKVVNLDKKTDANYTLNIYMNDKYFGKYDIPGDGTLYNVSLAFSSYDKIKFEVECDKTGDDRVLAIIDGRLYTSEDD